MKRHKCFKCGAKRREKFMKKSNFCGHNYFRSERFIWICKDEFCGSAMDKMAGLSSPLKSRNLEDCPGLKEKEEN